MAQNRQSHKQMVYNVDGYTGCQASLFIGDVFVDEAYMVNFNVEQHRKPVYGYASALFDDLTEGKVFVSGQIAINFKEAGYLWLILNRYRALNGQPSPLGKRGSFTDRSNIEQIINQETSKEYRQQMIEALTAASEADNTGFVGGSEDDPRVKINSLLKNRTLSSLHGYASMARADGGIGRAENAFEAFEDAVWGTPQEELDAMHRRADDPALGDFDIFLTFGDFMADNSVNHTVIKLSRVSIVGKSMIVEADGKPVMEIYNFICRNQV